MKAAFTGLVDIGVARLLKHAAGMVIREDKGVSNILMQI